MAAEKFMSLGSEKFGSDSFTHEVNWQEISLDEILILGVTVQKEEWTFMNKDEYPCVDNGKVDSQFKRLFLTSLFLF